MITPAYAQRMARYNRWQNENLYGSAGRLPASELTRNRGAFFGSIQETLCHLVITDQLWLHRFDPAKPPPRAKSIAESATAIADWDEMKRERQVLDATIIAWADKLDLRWLDRELEWYSMAMQRKVTNRGSDLLAHLFNHQTHHRGQVHCMLTQAGVKPDDTDLTCMDLHPLD